MVAQEADYVLALQGHQGTWYADVEWFFPWADGEPYRGIAHGTHETQTTGHGRVERRRTTVTDAIDWRQGRRDGVGWQTIVMVEAWRTQGHETSSERRYDISRLSPAPQQIGERVQRHWTIEHSLHWVLDLAFREDDSRIRTGNAPENFAMLRHIAVNLLKQEPLTMV